MQVEMIDNSGSGGNSSGGRSASGCADCLPACCGDTPYDPAVKGCCNPKTGTTYHLLTEGCCNEEVFDFITESCCERRGLGNFALDTYPGLENVDRETSEDDYKYHFPYNLGI